MNREQYARIKRKALATSIENIVRRLDNIFRRELKVRWELRVWEKGSDEPIVVTGPGKVYIPPKRIEITVLPVKDPEDA